MNSSLTSACRHRDPLQSVRRASPARRALTWLVASAFVCWSTGCAEPDQGKAIADHSDRVVTTELVGTFKDPESGKLESVSIGRDEFKLGDYRWSARELVVDGTSTTNAEDIYDGTETVVPLRSGGALTIRRTKDLLEVVNVETNASYDVSQIPKIRVSQNAVAVLSSEDDPEGITLNVEGIEDLPDAERSLALSLGLDILLATVEDSDTVAPAVIAAAVAAVAGVAFMAACGSTLYACINRCKEDFEVKCALIDVDVNWPSVKVGGAFGFGCKCR